MSWAPESFLAMQNIARSSDGKILIAELLRQQALIDKELRSASGDALLRLQGQAKFLEKFLEKLAKAPEVVGKLQTQGSGYR